MKNAKQNALSERLHLTLLRPRHSFYCTERETKSIKWNSARALAAARLHFYHRKLNATAWLMTLVSVALPCARQVLTNTLDKPVWQNCIEVP